MSEQIVLTANQVTQGIDWWLRQESGASLTGAGPEVNDHELLRRSYLQPFDDPTNKEARRAVRRSQEFMNRSRLADSDTLEDDYTTGLLISRALIFASDGFRTQSALQAASQAQYDILRFYADRAIGIPLYETVSTALESVRSTVQARHAAQILAEGTITAEAILASRKSVNNWFEHNPSYRQDAIGESEEPIRAALNMQRFGIGLAVSHIALAAELRDGEYANVPLLRPDTQSNTTPEILYLFSV